MKWPNDLLRREEQEEGPGWCKVGGILLEERPLPPHRETPAENLLVAGIGLNLVSSPPAALMRAQRAVPAGLLSSATKSNVSPLSVAGLWMRLVTVSFLLCRRLTPRGKTRGVHLLNATSPPRANGPSTDGPDEQERHTGILEGLDDFGGLRLRNRKEQTVSFPGAFGWTALPCSRDAKRHARRRERPSAAVRRRITGVPDAVSGCVLNKTGSCRV
ncbi:MAG: hypothetical protein ACLRWP_10265 [Bilophila wadsworthia]